MPRAKSVDSLVAEFQSFGLVDDNHTTFNLHGDFTPNFATAAAGKGFMANVYITLDETTEYSKSTLSFSATALLSAYGDAANPKLRFRCEGRFDPVGSGDCRYGFLVEVDQFGDTNIIQSKLPAGKGRVLTGPYYYLLV